MSFSTQVLSVNFLLQQMNEGAVRMSARAQHMLANLRETNERSLESQLRRQNAAGAPGQTGCAVFPSAHATSSVPVFPSVPGTGLQAPMHADASAVGAAWLAQTSVCAAPPRGPAEAAASHPQQLQLPRAEDDCGAQNASTLRNSAAAVAGAAAQEVGVGAKSKAGLNSGGQSAALHIEDSGLDAVQLSDGASGEKRLRRQSSEEASVRSGREGSSSRLSVGDSKSLTR